MQDDKKAFEAWADAKCYYLDKREDGHYEKGSTALAWEIAQYFLAVGRNQELEKAKAQAVPVWISVEDKLPEIADASVLAHFQNGSIETVHIEDWFKDITSGFDEAGNQAFTKWYLKASNTITHWMPLPESPIEIGA